MPPPSVFDGALAPFDAVAEKALAREPSDRYQSAEEFLEAVEQAASHAGGVATPRGVKREVNRWLGDKIAEEHAAIQVATDALGRSDLVPGVLPRPAESGSQPSQPQESLVRPIAGDDATLGAKPSTMPGAARPSRAWIPIVIVTLLLFVAGGALAVVLIDPRPRLQPVAQPAAAPEPPPEPVLQVPGPLAPPAPELAPTEAPIEPAPTQAAPSEPAPSEATPGEDEALERGARERRAQRRRRIRRAAQQAQAEPQETSEPPPPDTEDDVLANPYSR